MKKANIGDFKVKGLRSKLLLSRGSHKNVLKKHATSRIRILQWPLEERVEDTPGRDGKIQTPEVSLL